MEFQSYADLNARTMQLYRDQDFAQALELLTGAGGAFPEQAPEIYYLRSCLATRVGQRELALSILEEALNRGYWYGEQLLRESPSWQPLQGVPAFERMAQVCLTREAEARTGPLLLVEEPTDVGNADHPSPLFIALHGNGDNAKNALDCWRPVVSDGWLLAACQSSQIGGTDRYGWFDPDLAAREIEGHYATLRARYAIDADRVILAGFSMGGELALRLALSRAIPACGFIMLGPGGPMIETPDAWIPLMGGGANHRMHGYVLLGEEDANIPQDAARALVDLLNAHAIPCQIETLPDLGHGYPRDIAPSLGRALAFIRP